MSEAQENETVWLFSDGTVRSEQSGLHRQQCRIGAIVDYDLELDARADELEALRCLAYLLRQDIELSERGNGYLDQMDCVLDRMVDDLKKSA